MGWLDVALNAAQYAGWGAGIGGAMGAATAYLMPTQVLPSMQCAAGFHQLHRIDWTEVRCDRTYELVAVFTPGLIAFGALIGAFIGWAAWKLVKYIRTKPAA